MITKTSRLVKITYELTIWRQDCSKTVMVTAHSTNQVEEFAHDLAGQYGWTWEETETKVKPILYDIT